MRALHWQSPVLRGSLLAVICRGLYTMLLVVQIAILTRALSIGEYGIWASLAVIGSLSMLAVGVGAQLCNELSKEGPGPAGGAAAKRDLFLAAFSVIFWLVLAAFAAWLVLQGLVPWKLLINGSDARLFAIARAAFAACLAVQLLGLPFVIVSFAFRAYQENGMAAAFGPAATAVSLLFLWFFIKAGKIQWIYLAPFLAWGLVNGAGFLLLLRRRGWKFRLFSFPAGWALFSPFLRKSILFSGFALVFSLITVNLPYYAGLARGFQTAGKLDLYFKIYLVLLAAIADMLQPLWPAYSSRLSRRDFPWLRRSLKISVTVSLLLALCGSFLVRLLGPWLVRNVTGQAILIDGHSFLLLSFWLLLCSLAHALQVFLNAFNVVRPQLVAAVVFLVPLPLLCRRAGEIAGAAGPIVVNLLGIALILAIMAGKTARELAAGRAASSGVLSGQ
jgi:O-antigen/teichoic acid export membrane protein